MILKNKKAASLQTWTESIILAVVFVIIFGLVVADMNDTHSKNYNVTGLSTSGYESAINDYQNATSTKLAGGDVSFTSVFGLVLSTSWDVISSTANLIWGFLSGQWIRTIVIDYLQMPAAAAWGISSIFFIAIGFLIIRLLFRIKA